MREIKFRAWDKEKKEMFPVEEIRFGEKPMIWRWGTQTGIASKNCILMQYTGLKDKNGKEIYEGDILEMRHSDFDNGEEEIKSNCWRRVVEWENKYARFSISDIDINDFGWWPKEAEYECEIIGNIYEDEHLLNNKNHE